MPPMKVLVTPRSVTRDGHPALDLLRGAGMEVVLGPAGRQPTADELRSLLKGCAGYLAGVEPITAEILAAAPDLRAISRNGTGVDNVDLAAAEKHGISVLRAEGANARGVAELTLGLILALARRIPTADTALKRGGWERGAAGGEIEGKTLGLIGCGQVGRLVARLALGCDMRVMAFDPCPAPDFQPGPAFRCAALSEVLGAADFLSLHCPLSPDGRPILDATALSGLKNGAFLINTARHDLCDPDAVLSALETGRLAGLAVDVFDEEPPADSRIARHPRVVATPHLGGFTRESIDRAMTVAARNLLTALVR